MQSVCNMMQKGRILNKPRGDMREDRAGYEQQIPRMAPKCLDGSLKWVVGLCKLVKESVRGRKNKR